MAHHCLFVGIFYVLASAIVVHSQGDQSGYISIDCGIPLYDTPQDTLVTIKFVSDDAFKSTGVSFNVSEKYGYPEKPNFLSTLAEVRSFPRGNRNCYTLKTSQGKDQLNLIRSSFMYGNYDGKEALPEFDLYINENFWSTVRFKNASDQVVKEILSFAESQTIYICLVNNGIYGTEFGRNVSLILFQRWNIGYLN